MIKSLLNEQVVLVEHKDKDSAKEAEEVSTKFKYEVTNKVVKKGPSVLPYHAYSKVVVNLFSVAGASPLDLTYV